MAYRFSIKQIILVQFVVLATLVISKLNQVNTNQRFADDFFIVCLLTIPAFLLLQNKPKPNSELELTLNVTNGVRYGAFIGAIVGLIGLTIFGGKYFLLALTTFLDAGGLFVISWPIGLCIYGAIIGGLVFGGTRLCLDRFSNRQNKISLEKQNQSQLDLERISQQTERTPTLD